MDVFAATRLAIGTGCLLVAAASDLRTRRVRDPLWIGLGTIGLVLLAVELILRQAPWPLWSIAGSGALLFYGIFFGNPLFDEDRFHARPARIAVFLAATVLFLSPLVYEPNAPGLAELASMPVMIAVYQVFYRLRVLHGGADAKALIALSLLVPTYPDALPFPLFAVSPIVQPTLRVLFPFSLVVWVDAAVVSLAVPIALLIYNAVRGDFALPQALLGYRAPLDPLPKRVWLMERITEHGEHVLILFPKRGTDTSADVARLRSAGIERAWVQPQTPFMVPLLLGFLLAFVAGNLLVAILGIGR
ncbi:MAG TPA: A24 family peptidase C-terminal domain-containing protein [Thermoplasmata archaeon]|nr:A24 family peptidase C-terminal domain-containing protein [Thermoplasmata archaeon]